MTSRWNRWEPPFSTQELQRFYPCVRLDTDGKLGRVYSYYNYRRKRRVYLHILSPYAALLNETRSLQRAFTRELKRTNYVH